MSDVWSPPHAEVKDIILSGNPDAPKIRREHLNHEANIKAVGVLYLLSATIGFLAGALFLFVSFSAAQSEFPVAFGVGMAVFMIALSVFYVWIGRGLRSLNPVVRIPAAVLSALGLLGFPIGTLINGYILYLLLSRKGTMVFSDEYKQIIADTPYIKYHISIIVWIALALLLAAIALVIAIFASNFVVR